MKGWWGGGQLARQRLNTPNRWAGGERPRLKADGQLARQPELIEADNRPVAREEGATRRRRRRENRISRRRKVRRMLLVGVLIDFFSCCWEINPRACF